MPQRAKVSLVVCSAMFMAGLDLFIVNLAFPQIGREFRGTSLATVLRCRRRYDREFTPASATKAAASWSASRCTSAHDWCESLDLARSWPQAPSRISSPGRESNSTTAVSTR
jgi:hypothetical protein